ncbi:MAG TPA: lipid-A-disaccharide synthase, partial [Bacteroidales bacterium]
MKYYIIAGEASGDLHGSNLIKAIKLSDIQANIRCWGGDLMQAEGGTLVKHYRETAYMGLFEVIAHAGAIKKNFDFCYSDILAFSPDVLILIDYPGFNLRVARFAKEHGIKVFYYISPKVWVWKESRVKHIKKYVDRMFVIFPFEKEWYATRHQFEVDYAGNPLIDAIEEKKQTLCTREEFISRNNLYDKPVIALLPGSRKQEVLRLLPIMTSIVEKFPDYQFVIAGTSALDSSFYQKLMVSDKAAFVVNQTYELLYHAHAAVVASGTATLETALFNVPQVVCYRISTATFVLGRPFVPVKYFSLVNIIMDEEVVKELLQYHLIRDITNELSRILNDNKYRQHMLDKYKELREK